VDIDEIQMTCRDKLMIFCLHLDVELTI